MRRCKFSSQCVSMVSDDDVRLCSCSKHLQVPHTTIFLLCFRFPFSHSFLQGGVSQYVIGIGIIVAGSTLQSLGLSLWKVSSKTKKTNSPHVGRKLGQKLLSCPACHLRAMSTCGLQHVDVFGSCLTALWPLVSYLCKFKEIL